MRLHWFREHKQIVYYVICPAIVLSMSIFGFGQFGKGSLSAKSGPAVSYTAGTKEGYLSPSEVMAQRLRLFKFVQYYDPKNNSREDNATTNQVGLMAAELEIARQRGFAVGDDEMKEVLRNVVKNKIAQIDNDRSGGKEVVVTKELYGKLLEQLDMTAGQFEQLIHDLMVREKFHQTLQDSIDVSDQQMFLKYAGEKEYVRIRYKKLASDDFVKEAKQPTDTEIKDFYEKHLTEKTGMVYKDVYMTPATMSVEALAYKDDKAFADIKPSADDLKKSYDTYKVVYFKDTTDPTKKDVFKPFDAVKTEVERMWREDKISELKRTVQDNVAKALKELSDDEAKAKDPKNKDAKPVDMAAWVAKHKFIRWETPEQTEEKYSKGKLEVNAPDLSLATNLFNYAKGSPNQSEAMLASQTAHLYEFTSFRWLDEKKPELGGIVCRAKKYTAEVTKTQEQAKDKIVEQLKVSESVTLARKAADKLHDEWKEGKNLPKVEELDEVSSAQNEYHPLVRSFRSSPTVVGEVLTVGEGPIEQDEYDPKNAEKKWFYVGCVVERKLPTLAGFELEPEEKWSREEAKHGKTQYGYRMKSGIVDDNYKSQLGLMVEQIKSKVMYIGNVGTEPDVRNSYHDSRNSDN